MPRKIKRPPKAKPMPKHEDEHPKKRPPTLADRPYAISEGVTQSLLSTWVGCRQHARLHLDGWRSEQTKDSMTFGIIEHYLLEGYYGAIRDGEVTRASAEAYCDGRLAAWAERSRRHATQSAAERTAEEFCVAKARALWPAYVRRWKNDLKKSRHREVESKFDVNFAGYRLRGMIDETLYIKGAWWIQDHKTKARIDGEAISQGLAFDFQALFYITAAEITLAETYPRKKPKVAGIIYNVIRNPQHRLKQAESLAAYTKRVRDDTFGVDKKTGLPRIDHYFLRFEATYDERTKAEFRAELLAKLQEFEAWLRDDLPTYRNQGACQTRWNCRYLKACAAGGNMVGYVRDGRLFEELE